MGQHLNGRDILLALPEKEKWILVFDKLEEHQEKHEGHDKNFLECDRKFQATINEIRAVSENQSKAIKTHAAASERRHMELMANQAAFQDKLSTVIAISENSKRGAGVLMLIVSTIKDIGLSIGSALKKIGLYAKDAFLGVAAIFLCWSIFTGKLSLEQFSAMMTKLFGGK